MKKFHIYHFGVHVAETIDATVAAAVAGMTSEGVVKFDRKVVYDDELDGHIAGDSWDAAANLMIKRIGYS